MIPPQLKRKLAGGKLRRPVRMQRFTERLHRAVQRSEQGKEVINSCVCVCVCYLKQDGAASGKGIPEHLGRVLLQQSLTRPAGSTEAGKAGAAGGLLQEERRKSR